MADSFVDKRMAEMHNSKVKAFFTASYTPTPKLNAVCFFWMPFLHFDIFICFGENVTSVKSAHGI